MLLNMTELRIGLVQLPSLGFVDSPAVGALELGIKETLLLIFLNVFTLFKLLEVFSTGRNSMVLISLTSADHGSSSVFNPSGGRETKACPMTSLTSTVIGRTGQAMFRT